MLAAALAVLPAGGTPAQAVGGDPLAADAYGFVTKVVVGAPGAGGRACTGALVGPRWVITAKECFAVAGRPVVAGRPALPATATIARPDLAATGTGFTVSVLSVVPHPERDLVLAELAVSVEAVTPVRPAVTAPVAGEVVQVAGFGRTATEWVPDRGHLGTFTVTPGAGPLIGIAGVTGGQVGPCRGDAGGPGLRTTGGVPELIGVTHSADGQGGCLGAAADAARGGTQTRVDDVGAWLAQTTAEPTVNTLKVQLGGLCLATLSGSTEAGTHVIQGTCNGHADQDWRISPRTADTVELRNDHSDMCLAIAGGSKADGAHLLQWNCRDNPDQLWQLTKDANGYTRLRNTFSNECMAVEGGSKAAGAHLLQWPCRTANVDQNWLVTSRVPGAPVRNEFSGLCLSNGGSTADGAHAVQAACDGSNDAEWRLRARTGGYAELRNDRSGECLAIAGGSKEDGAHALQWPCRDNPDQFWLVEVDAGGLTRLRNRFTDRCLAIQSGSKNAGAHLLQWPCRDNPDQIWRL